jgi:hypothetical protein
MFCDLSNISNKEFVSENHGIIDNEICIKNSQIVELEEKIKKLFSFTEKIIR